MGERLIRAVCSEVKLDDYLGGDPEEHLNFVCACVLGLGDDAPWPENIGRSEGKRFLFDVVACKRSGIDVDKLDYLVRDTRSTLGNESNLEIGRLVRSSRVVSPEPGAPGRRGNIF